MTEGSSDIGIDVTAVKVVFDGVTVLEEIDLQVGAGEIVALKGSSGSGKTTLLHAIAGFVPLSGGQISVAGQDISSLPEKSRAKLRRETLGLMTQDFHLLRKLSAERNAALAPLLAGVAPEESMRTARLLLDQLGLQDHYRAPANRLSRGQRQRVALARALALPRPYLLLDEPTSSLDSDSRGQVLRLIEERAAAGTAVLIATHDESVLPTAHRTLFMKGGRILEES